MTTQSTLGKRWIPPTQLAQRVAAVEVVAAATVGAAAPPDVRTELATRRQYTAINKGPFLINGNATRAI
jgi:hypothetical protein